MATYQQLFNLCKKKFNISWLYGQSHANEKLFLTEKAKHFLLGDGERIQGSHLIQCVSGAW